MKHLIGEDTHQKRSIKSNTSEYQSLKNQHLQSISQIYLLQTVIESFVDGILILTTQGELVHINEYARQICCQLDRGVALQNKIPGEIWRVCQYLIESSDFFCKEEMSIESEIEVNNLLANNLLKLRIRCRWLILSGGENRNFLLITLEDRDRTTEGIAIADAKKYGLTSRETEVWQLRRADLTYKEIAAKLSITTNTVKKHIKSIYAKQQGLISS